MSNIIQLYKEQDIIININVLTIHINKYTKQISVEMDINSICEKSVDVMNIINIINDINRKKIKASCDNGYCIFTYERTSTAVNEKRLKINFYKVNILQQVNSKKNFR